jgi:hypothetical protein
MALAPKSPSRNQSGPPKAKALRLSPAVELAADGRLAFENPPCRPADRVRRSLHHNEPGALQVSDQAPRRDIRAFLQSEKCDGLENLTAFE